VPFLDATLPDGVFLASESNGGAEGGLLIGQFYGDAADVAEPGSIDLEESEGRIETWGLPGSRDIGIRWWPGSAQGAALEVFSSSGRRVAQVLPMERERAVEGRALSYRWDGTDFDGARLPAGMYFIRAPGNGSPPASGKLVLLD